MTINDGYVTWKDNADVATFAKKALAYANTQNHIINSDKSQIAPAAAAGATTSTVAFSDLPLGYYLVDSVREHFVHSIQRLQKQQSRKRMVFLQ